MRMMTRALGALLLPFSISATAAEPLTLEQIMAAPDWIGAPVEAPHWALDGSRVLYSQKRTDSPVRDLYAITLADGTVRTVDDGERAQLDAATPVYDAQRLRALFVRNGDLFLRDLRNQALLPLTRTGDVSGTAMFSANGQRALFRRGNDWFAVDLGTRLVETVAQLKAEKDPDADPKPDAMRDLQLELIATLAQRKADKATQREQDNAQRAADATRAPAPIFLGDDISISRSALSPDGRWLLAVTQNKKDERGQVGKMPVYVTESGYEDVEDVRTRVGRNPLSGQKVVLVDLVSRSSTEIKLDALTGIKDDPLAEMRKAAGKDALDGLRPVRIGGIEFSEDGRHAAVMFRANDNKDRWIASLEDGKPALKLLHRLTDPAWINWNFNEFGWLPDNRTLWLLSEESGHSHLYTVGAKGKAKALTQGQWEASSPQLSADGKRFYFLCNQAWPGDYEVCSKDIASGPVRELTALNGVEDFSLSPDGKNLLV